MNLQGKIDRIKNSLDTKSYTLASGECVKIIELSFRKLLVDGLALLSDSGRLKVMKAILEVGKGVKGVGSFGLGQMLAVIRKSKFLDEWESSTQCDLGAIRMINLEALNDVRIKLTHDAAEATKFEAEFLFNALEGIIQTFGVLKLEGSIKKDDSQMKDNAQEVVPKEGKASFIGKGKKGSSSYSPIAFDELRRLEIQSDFVRDIDIDAFKHALGLIDKKEGLIALDVGCSDGLVTTNRFNSFDSFQHVIGIDKSEEAVHLANSRGIGNYSFYTADIEEDGVIKTLNNALEEIGAKGFDIIYSAYVFHHIGEPIKPLRKLRKLLNPNGVIIIRTVEDGLGVSHPDPKDLAVRIFECSERIPNESNRRHGRTLYNELWKTGYRNINLFYKVIDTVGKSIEEKMALFQFYFAWRPVALHHAIRNLPEKKGELMKELDWLTEALEELEIMLESEDYYQAITVPVAIGQKK